MEEICDVLRSTPLGYDGENDGDGGGGGGEEDEQEEEDGSKKDDACESQTKQCLNWVSNALEWVKSTIGTLQQYSSSFNMVCIIGIGCSISCARSKCSL